MNRLQLIQQIIDCNRYNFYLEIGVFEGSCFFQVRCRKKIAVDPEFAFSKKEKFRALLKNFSNFSNSFYETTSDAFFQSGVLKTRKLDIVFIDGLHTFKQSLLDVLNSLRFLQPNGFIVLHDCFPPSKASSTPADSFKEAKSMNVPGWTGEWCGDVWKTLAYIKIAFPQVELACLENDYGLGMVKLKDTRLSSEALKIDDTIYEKADAMTYEEMLENKKDLINVISEETVESFLRNGKN